MCSVRMGPNIPYNNIFRIFCQIILIRPSLTLSPVILDTRARDLAAYILIVWKYVFLSKELSS